MRYFIIYCLFRWAEKWLRRWRGVYCGHRELTGPAGLDVLTGRCAAAIRDFRSASCRGRKSQGSYSNNFSFPMKKMPHELMLSWDNLGLTIPSSIAGELPVSVMEEVRETLECETFNGSIRDTPIPLLTISIIFVGAFAPAWKRRIEGACFYDVQNYLHAYPPHDVIDFRQEKRPSKCSCDICF